MHYKFKTLSFVVNLALLTAVPAFTQTPAQSPVAYVYVAENGPANSQSGGPISIFAASAAGELTQVKGSPFAQSSFYIVGDTGTDFVTLDSSSATTHQYLRTYEVTSTGAIGAAVAKQDLHEWCGLDAGATLDHSGEYVYVLDNINCGGAIQTFAISKTGELTFKSSTDVSGEATPIVAGNETYAYTVNTGNDQPCPTDGFVGLKRESDGDLNSYTISVTGPSGVPTGEEVLSYSGAWMSPDPTNHLAALIYYGDSGCEVTSGPRLVSYSIESDGDLVSTSTWSELPALDGNPTGGDEGLGRPMSLNPAGNILAIAVGTGTQFFHFNGASPMTKLSDVIGSSGYIATLAWDKSNHLYALNEATGRLHVYAVTTSKVEEVSGSPYTVPYCGEYHGSANCPQSLIVHSVN